MNKIGGVHLLPIDVQDKQYKAVRYEYAIINCYYSHSSVGLIGLNELTDEECKQEVDRYMESRSSITVFNKAPKKAWGTMVKEIREYMSSQCTHIIFVRQNTLINTEEDYNCIKEFDRYLEDTNIIVVIEEKINPPHLDRPEFSNNEVIRKRLKKEFESDDWEIYRMLTDKGIPVPAIDSRLEFLDTTYFPRVQLLLPEYWDSLSDRAKGRITWDVQMKDGFLPLLRNKIYDDKKFIEDVKRRLA